MSQLGTEIIMGGQLYAVEVKCLYCEDKINGTSSSLFTPLANSGSFIASKHGL